MNNNMMQLAAAAHQAELRRSAAVQRLAKGSTDDTAAADHRLQRVVDRVRHARASRRSRAATAVPRVSI